MNRGTRTLSLGLTLLFANPAAGAVFTVTTTADAGPGSLRAAITAANAMPGPDVVQFAIPGAGVHTIVPLSALPALTDPQGVLIDGFSQVGAGPGALPPATAVLLIQIQGTMAGAADGISIQADLNQVRGLVINGFQQDGIHIVGGIANATASFNVVCSNFVGTDPSGTLAMGNGTAAGLHAGIHVGNVANGSATNNTVDTNLVSANTEDGIWIAGPIQPGAVSHNFVRSNFAGTDVTGTLDLGNRHQGIVLTEGTTNNQVLTNLASGNDYDGIGLQGFDNFPFPGGPILTSNNLISQNVVGLDVSASVPLPNTMHGIAVGLYGPTTWGCANANTIVQNTIAFNGGDGVAVVEHSVDSFNADGNRITQNSIWSNGGLGIDLDDDGVTANDGGDPDNRANQDLNFPVITSAVHAAGQTTVKGTLTIDSSPALATVEVFRAQADPSGHGEGRVYLGSATPDAAGSWSFTTATMWAGADLTSTATDAATNTSEFGPIRRVRAKYRQRDCSSCPTVTRTLP